MRFWHNTEATSNDGPIEFEALRNSVDCEPALHLYGADLDGRNDIRVVGYIPLNLGGVGAKRGSERFHGVESEVGNCCESG